MRGVADLLRDNVCRAGTAQLSLPRVFAVREKKGRALLILRTQCDPADGTVLGEADAPLRRAVGEMGHVDVVV